MAKVIEYASKLADNQEKLATRFTDLSVIVGEAATWAKLDKAKIVTKEYVEKAGPMYRQAEKLDLCCFCLFRADDIAEYGSE